MKTNRNKLTVLLASFIGLFASDALSEVKNSFTEPYESIELAAAESGVVATLFVQEGERVRKGDVLAELNSDVLKQELRMALHHIESTAKRDAAAATLKIKQTQLQNLEPLLKTGHANSAEVEQVRMEVEVAQSELTLAEEEATAGQLVVDKIEAQLVQRRIVCPVEGVVTRLYRKRGEHVSISEPQFARVVQLDRLRVRFYLGRSDIERIEVGQQVPTLIDNEVVLSVVEFISPVTDPDSGTARVDVIIDNADGQFRSGIPCILLDSDEAVVGRTSDE